MAATRTTAAVSGQHAPAATSVTSPRSGRRPGLARAPHPAQGGPRSSSLSAVPHEISPVLRRQAASDLLGRADAELLAAELSTDPAERFTHAHMAALRVAGAVLAVVGTPPPRGRTRSAWERLSAAAADFGPWASFFASGAHLRASIDAGRFDAVDEAGAARWVAAAEDFRDEVGTWVDDDEAPLGRSRVLLEWSVSA